MPSVGIFWEISGVIVIDCSALHDAEHYGDCITHAKGHYDFWQEWQALGGTALAVAGYPKSILSTEYDEWPRGRIVYETRTSRFVLYADVRLQKPSIVTAIKNAFGISDAAVAVKSDLHYRASPASWD
jgi:hypothetical protein